MVDAAASFDGKHSGAGAARSDLATGCAVEIHHMPAQLSAFYGASDAATFSPAQSPAWIKSWIEAAQPDFLVASLSKNGNMRLDLALEIVSVGPFRIARFMGGNHANGNFPPTVGAGAISRSDIDSLISAIHKSRPDIDMLSLERLADRISGHANPLMQLPHAPSPNISLAVDLAGGFEAVLERSNGKRKRKRHRSQARKLEAIGGYRLVTARTAAETERFLDAFFSMKQDRFRKMGVPDVFASSEVKDFFRLLFASAASDETPEFELNGLEANGQILAVTGSSRCGKRLVCEFGAICDGDMAHTSPGEFLFYENIKKACNDGSEIYDFSVGDEPYKRLWCDIECTQYDVIVPLTAKGVVLAVARRAAGRLKTFIKHNQAVWALAKSLRRRRGSSSAISTDA